MSWASLQSKESGPSLKDKPFEPSEGEHKNPELMDIDADLHMDSIIMLLFLRRYVMGHNLKSDIETLIHRLHKRIKEKGERGSPIMRHIMNLSIKNMLDNDPIDRNSS